MRKLAVLSIVLLITLVAGCSAPTLPPSPSPEPSSTPTSPPPSPTTEAEAETDEDTATPMSSPTPSGPATCEPFSFPVEERIPSVDEDDHIEGPEDAPITFIEYADFQCPACAGLRTMRDYLQEQYGDQIRFIYRHLPLISIHDKAIITAEAAEAAGAQGKFWEMHDLLYEKQQEWGQFSGEELQETLVGYAEDLELDAERFAQELEDHVYEEQIMADYEAYQEYGQMATPTYVVNKIFYPTQQFGGFGQISSFIDFIQMSEDMYEEAPPQVIDEGKEYQATLRTSKGDIVVDLFPEEAPTNVNSFVFLAEEGWYDGLDFFYVDTEMVALSGDPTNTGGGLPYPGYYCGDETSPDLTFEEPGKLALYTPAPGRNSSSFFINYVPQPEFTGNFTIIGEVVEGMDVAESLTELQPGAEDIEPDTLETILIEEK